MTEIPDHVSVEIARKYIAHNFKSDEPWSATITRAILDERERCAKIAEEFTVTVYAPWDEELTEPFKSKLPEANEIAAAIRRR